MRTAGNTKVVSDNFSAKTAKYDEALAISASGSGEIIEALVPDKSVLRIPAEPVEIAMPRYIAGTEPAADRTPGEVIPIDPDSTQNGQNANGNARTKLSAGEKAAVIACCAVAAAAVAAAVAVIAVKKRKGR